MTICHPSFVLHVGRNFPVTDDICRFTWEEGATQATATAVDLTGYVAELTVRAYPTAPTVLLTLTDASGITLGGVAGTIDVAFTAAQATALGVGVFPYQLLLTPPSGPADAFYFAEDYITVLA